MLVQLKDKPKSGIARAHEIATNGCIVDRPRPLAVRLPKACIGAARAGTVWWVEGDIAIRTLMIGDYRVEQDILHASSAEFRRPSGDLLARWIASNVPGIGEVIARRLLRALPDLDQRVRDRDLEAMRGVAGMSDTRARALLDHWPSKALYDVLTWLQDVGLPLGLSERLCRVYGEATLDTLKRDPFSLLGFGIPFPSVLDIARTFGIDQTDDRLVIGLADHAAAQITARTGSTVIPEATLLRQIQRNRVPLPAAALARAPALACKAGVLITVPGGYQTIGHALMERTVARFLTTAAQRQPGEEALFAGWERHTSRTEITDALEQYELGSAFRFTDEQRRVIVSAVQSPVAILNGEAGTGKTTLLRAILAIYDALARIPLVQVALSGRAARRMAEATRRPASTIAKFVSDHLGPHKPDPPEHLLLVIDEASMLDILSAYRLVGILPEATRILFVGDVAQLPPVGPGLVFHALITTTLPVLRLSKVQRHGADSGIYRVATALRENRAPELPPLDTNLKDAGDVAYTSDISLENIERLWRQAGGAARTIILSPTRKGDGGVDRINSHLQKTIGLDRPAIHYLDDVHGWIPWLDTQGRPLCANDQIMVSVNDYEADIRNGDLGTITHVLDSPAPDGSVGIAEIDGREVPLTTNVLSSLTLGYAITVHKSQGSQWPVCILMLPTTAIPMTDRTLLYTAATRPTEQLVCCGDRRVLDQATKRPGTSSRRRSNLASLLRIQPNLTKRRNIEQNQLIHA